MLLACVLLPLVLCLPARAETPLLRRAHQAAGLIAESPDWPKDLFAASFSRQVSDAQLKAIGAQYFASNGAVREVQQVSLKGEHAGTFDLILAKGTVVRMNIAVSEQAPWQVTGLVFGLPSPMLKTLDDASAELAKLPGSVGFGVWKLGEGAPQPLVERNADRPLAIGSAFKLWVLGALVEEVKAGRRHASDTVRLRADLRSLPSGRTQAWPDGSPATLSTLANLMISESDNTATDALMDTLGRERVEASLPTMGMADPARTRPFLTTAEMFRLKFVDGGKAGEGWANLDETGRRALLAKGLPAGALTLDALGTGAFDKPRAIDTLEWFASAADLARAMDWLRRNADGPPETDLWVLGGALTINRGLDISEKRFPWVGFKGGSEPGVLCLAYLLKSADGAWYALAATWNNPTTPLDEMAFTAIVQRAIWVLGKPRAQADTP